MEDFVYTSLPARVIFGQGTTARLPEEVARLSLDRVLILTTPGQEAEGNALHELLGPQSAGVHPYAAMHTPVPVTEAALDVFRQSGATGLVAIGGGSTTGLSKAIALRTGAPQIVLPTSSAGSEMTPILGQTEGGRKTTQSTLDVLPETVIYDVDHTLGMPLGMTITSGMNAIAHAVEALYSPAANPLLSLMAAEAVGRMSAALVKLPGDARDADLRAEALYGAWLCAVCLGTGGVALHHKLCHVLGGTFDLPHAETHTIVLPHALAYNAPAVPDTMATLRRVMDCPDPAAGLFDIAEKGGAAVALKDIGMPLEGIDQVIEQTLQTPYPNPRPLEARALRDLLTNAWHGLRPEV